MHLQATPVRWVAVALAVNAGPTARPASTDIITINLRVLVVATSLFHVLRNKGVIGSLALSVALQVELVGCTACGPSSEIGSGA